MKTKKRIGFVLGYVGFGAAVACGNDGSKASATNGLDAGGRVEQFSRSQCGNVPERSRDFLALPEACKSASDTTCCDAANACANDPTCVQFNECVGACPTEGTCDCGAQPQTTTDFINCISGVEECRDFSCGDAPWPPVAAETLTLNLIVRNFLTGAALAGVQVRSCPRTDTECNSPIDVQTSGSDGSVAVKIPSSSGGTDAYLEFTGADVIPTLVFEHLYNGAANFKKYVYYQGLLDSGTAHALWGAAGATGDLSTRGILTTQAFSCGGTSLAGATLSATGTDASTVQTYFETGLPSATATATDGSGLSDFVDFPPGPTTVTATYKGKKLGSVTAFVRAGYNNIVGIEPEGG